MNTPNVKHEPAPRFYNEEEMQALFAQHTNKIIDYWNNPANEPEEVNRVRAAVQTVLGTLDGNCPGMPEYSVRVMPGKVDRNNESYHPGMRDFAEVEIGGDLMTNLEVYGDPKHPLANFRKEFNAMFGVGDDFPFNADDTR